MKIIRTLFCALLALCICTSVSHSFVYADETDVITVYVDGEQILFDVNPILEDDRTLVPMRAIFEALGAEVSWDDASQTAIAVKDGDTMKITIDSKTLYKNDTAIALDVPARMVGDRTLVPVRAVSESFDATVEWDEANQRVIITTSTLPEPSSSPVPSPVQSSVPSALPNSSETIPKDALPANTLSDADMKTMNTQKEVIRYNFEQRMLPKFVFSSPDVVYKTLTENSDAKDDFNDMVRYAWDYNLASYIMSLQSNSESTYAIDNSFTASLESALSNQSFEELESLYSEIIDNTEMEYDNYISEVHIETSHAGAVIAVVEFKDASSLVNCKYLGIVCDKSGKCKYYTAENDIVTPDSWFFCFVELEADNETISRGTITFFDKNDKSLDKFIELSFDTFYNGFSSAVTTQL